MSDTPRTDAHSGWGVTYRGRTASTELYVDSTGPFVHAQFARQLERELNAANERIRRLDGRCQALDDQVCNLLEICRQHGVDVSSQDMINGRRKAKEAKP